MNIASGIANPASSLTSIDIKNQLSTTSSLTMVTQDLNKQALSVCGNAKNGIRLRLSAIQEGSEFASAPSNFI